jgi:chitin synthase
MLSYRQQPVQATKEWDVFTNNPPVIISGSMADQSCMQTSLRIIKLLAYICTFMLVLGGAVISKGTMLFMTSQLRSEKTIPFCGTSIGNYASHCQFLNRPHCSSAAILFSECAFGMWYNH